jgi:energy-coupling factor transporter ATPase
MKAGSKTGSRVPGKKAPLFEVLHLTYSYPDMDSPALRGVDVSIAEGEYAAIIGPNGSGKTTLLKHLNALLTPVSGDVLVSGWNTKDHTRLIDIRRTVGMVFQDPSASIIQSTVEEEVAFGPENLGVPAREIEARVARALEAAGLLELRERPCAFLSTGQKQRLAVAAALAMEPHCLLLDEAGSMLDFSSRERLVETVEKLHRKGVAVVSVTQDMDEAARAARVIVMSEGRVAMDGTARDVFARETELGRLKLGLPKPAEFAARLRKTVPGFPLGALALPELAREIEKRVTGRRAHAG